jgi:hypothetical protein
MLVLDGDRCGSIFGRTTNGTMILMRLECMSFRASEAIQNLFSVIKETLPQTLRHMIVIRIED